MIPTANFIEFSGTRESGARTATPIPAVTTTSAQFRASSQARFSGLGFAASPVKV